MSSITQSITQTNNEFSQALSSQTSGSSLDKDSFMLLLVTQFKYQDPLNPMEDKEFISQMAQFSSLEQLMNLNDSMEGLTTATNNQQMINATSYIGKNVTVSGNAIGKRYGRRNQHPPSPASAMRRQTPWPAAPSLCATAQPGVYTQTLGTPSSGTTNWNGQTSSGATAPDGVYTVSLSAQQLGRSRTFRSGGRRHSHGRGYGQRHRVPGPGGRPAHGPFRRASGYVAQHYQHGYRHKRTDSGQQRQLRQNSGQAAERPRQHKYPPIPKQTRRKLWVFQPACGPAFQACFPTDRR